MTTYYVRQHGSDGTDLDQTMTEHPTDGDARGQAQTMSLLHGGQWLVIRKTGRLSTVIGRYPSVTEDE